MTTRMKLGCRRRGRSCGAVGQEPVVASVHLGLQQAQDADGVGWVAATNTSAMSSPRAEFDVFAVDEDELDVGAQCGVGDDVVEHTDLPAPGSPATSRLRCAG